MSDAAWTGALLGGRYRVGRLLGEGGMGAVYEAAREDLGGRRVALKLLHPEMTSNESLVLRFRREAETVAALGHPNIVQVTDFSALPGEPVFLVMELLTGQSLSQAITTDGPLEAGRLAFIATQTLSALSAAHAAHIVHRDLKPDNIFLTAMSGVRDVAKLLDFGIAKLIDGTEVTSLTMTGSVLGTPTYMSPEQARGMAVDQRTDIYALGVVMYEALSGRAPFEATNYNALLFSIVSDTPPPLSSLRADLDPGFVAVVERAMARDAAARWKDAEAMTEALAPYVVVGFGKVSSTAQGPSQGMAQGPRQATAQGPSQGMAQGPRQATAHGLSQGMAAGPLEGPGQGMAQAAAAGATQIGEPVFVVEKAAAPGNRPSFLGAARLTFVRPEDEATRAGVAQALGRVGAQVAQIFRHPVDLGALKTYLGTAGRADALVIPYVAREGQSGVELAAALHDAGGIPRRILMHTKTVPAATVRDALRKAMGPHADRVYVVALGELLDGARAAEIAAHLRRTG